MRRVFPPGIGILIVLSSFAALADAIPNWTAPGTWKPVAGSSAGTAKTALATTYHALPFIPVTPCRMADTRASSGFPAGYGPPSLPGVHAQRNFTIGGRCGIPAGAEAVSVNVTVWAPVTRGDLRLFPAGDPTPTVATLNWEAGIQALANAAVVPLGIGWAVTVQVDGPGTVDLIVDVNGYYGTYVKDSLTGNLFISTDKAGDGAIVGNNSNGTGFGVMGTNYGSGKGVYGYCNGPGTGVYGFADFGPGVAGASSTSWGVQADSSASDALVAKGGRDGIFSQGARHGTVARSTGTVGVLYGVDGSSASTNFDSAGVRGTDGTGGPGAGSVTGYATAGVRGESKLGFGVLGISNLAGVQGTLVNASGAGLASGFLGTTFGTANDSATGPWGIFAAGNFGAFGAKHFVEPHGTDPSRVIVYSSLEGREVGTYFRGTTQASEGRAVIPVPADFRMVTDEDGLTVQLTPLGAFAQMYVEFQSLEEITIRSSRDVRFHYLVQGVRRAFRNFEPVGRGDEFMPRSADARIPAYLTEEARRRLVQNGTYHENGTVNMQTAERMGWARTWREEERVRQQAVSHEPEAPLQSPKQ
jgi:hypothetical protein